MSHQVSAVLLAISIRDFGSSYQLTDGCLVVAAVYLLDEITELVSAGGDTAQGLADATIRRLNNKSPIVKQKVACWALVTMLIYSCHCQASSWNMQVLRLIKHVSNKGAPEYRRAICKQAKDIR